MAYAELKHQVLTAQEACKLNPGRYIIPPADAAVKLRAGHVIKLLVDSRKHAKAEELWITITHRQGTKFIGMVNDPVARTRFHGLAQGSPIEFRLAQILDIGFRGPKVQREYKIL